MKHLPLVLFCILIFFFIKKRFFDNTDYRAILNSGGIIIDVRSGSEFLTGNIENSVNIPLAEIPSSLNRFNDKNQPIITCCASGIRSAAAKKIFITKGYTNVINGGGWRALQNKIID